MILNLPFRHFCRAVQVHTKFPTNAAPRAQNTPYYPDALTLTLALTIKIPFGTPTTYIRSLILITPLLR